MLAVAMKHIKEGQLSESVLADTHATQQDTGKFGNKVFGNNDIKAASVIVENTFFTFFYFFYKKVIKSYKKLKKAKKKNSKNLTFFTFLQKSKKSKKKVKKVQKSTKKYFQQLLMCAT
jgi:hypothetical protein